MNLSLPNSLIFLRCRLVVRAIVFLFLVGSGSLIAQRPAWSPVGPAGGDARGISGVPGNPDHLYLGTTNSWVYESADGGASWQRLAKMPGADTLVLDHVVVDSSSPTTIYVAAWRTDAPGGGLWISHNAGQTWTESAGLSGQSIFSFAQAQSDPRMLFAGTLEGVFRSKDSGVTWTQISPAGSKEIHNVESLAVDPANPGIVYAGTWHLPWKTEDGGKTWKNIKQGIIDDSDVFSIVIDPEHTRTVYLSACSGIYKSENAGTLFRKIQGIPADARRTRALVQDPTNRQVLYAGTTEGLYKTENAGKTFRLMTGSDVVVNDVFVDPNEPKHVLLATDRGGVLASKDGGSTFVVSNSGISERKVEALLVDRADPQRLYAGVVNDKNYGGVFVSANGGKDWTQTGSGLDGRDVYVLAQTKDSNLVAGTNAGIFALDPDAAGDAKSNPVWQSRNTIANTITKMVNETVLNTRVTIEKQQKVPSFEFSGRVLSLDVSGDVWVAATSFGVITSHDQGSTWQGGPVIGATDYLSVSQHEQEIAAARADGVVLSKDSGQTWWPMPVPQMLTRIHRVTFSPDGTLWLGAREGVYFTRDLGKTWMWVQRLPFRDVDDLAFDEASGRLLVSSRSSDQIYGIDPKTLTWKWWTTGYPIALIRAAGPQLVAASVRHGVLLEPRLNEDVPGSQSASLPGAQATPAQ